jgi:intracellular septation protein
MATQPINPFLKQVLELGPTVMFFIVYTRIKDDVFTIGGTEYSGFILSTLIFIPILLVAMGLLWALTKELSRMQIFTAFMVIFFGGLTAYFNDERFFKMKTSIVYMMIAAVLGFGLLRGKSYMALPMEHKGWMILTLRVALFCVALAVFNEWLWRTQSTDLWVKIETFAFPVISMIFLGWQFYAVRNYMIEEDTGPK